MRHVVLVVLFILSYSVNAKEFVTEFEKDSDGELIGWSNTSPETGAVDTDVVYEGQTSFRLMRVGDDMQETIFVLQKIPLNFDAEVIEVRARLKAKGTSPSAGINVIMQQDVAGNVLQFDNTRPFVTGDETDWEEVQLAQAIQPQAENLMFGAVLAGPGTGWISDVELWADGERLMSLPEPSDPSAAVPAEQWVEEIEGRDIAWDSLDDAQVEDLALLVQVWGFLKYMHPGVAQDAPNWDAPFIKAVHELVAGEELPQVLTGLLDEAGEAEYGDEQPESQPDELIATFKQDWFQDNGALGNDVVSALESLRENRDKLTEGQYAFTDTMGMPTFVRERKYSAPHLERELQLLALARVWNVMEYWFPYRENIKADWYATLRDYIPRMLQASSHRDFQHELQTVLGKLDDGHASLSGYFSGAPFGACSLPFAVLDIDNAIVVSRVADSGESGQVQPGDILVAINGTSTAEMMEQWMPSVSASNDIERRFSLANSLLSRPCDETAVKVTLNRDGVEQEIELRDYEKSGVPPAHSLEGEAIQSLSHDITYVKVSGLGFEKIEQAVAQASDSGKLVIDARGYPQNFIVHVLGSRLVQEPTLFGHVAYAQPHTPGVVSVSDEALMLEPYNPVELDGLAILVDETTLSQSEFSVLAWRQAPNAIVVGSKTAGAVGDVRNIPLPDGQEVYFTGGRILDKNKEDVQYRGIEPDFYVKPSASDIAAGRDAMLDKAIELLSTPEGK